MKELNFEQMAAVEGGGCSALNMLAGAMIGGAVGGLGGAVVGGVLMCFLQ
ncbi:MAG: bacteriocin [Candidatus Kapaibacteriota bacterium]